MRLETDSASQEFRVSGIPASPGFAIGPLWIYEKGEVTLDHYEISENQIKSEIERLESAIQKTREQLQSIQQEVSESIGAKDAEIFEAHILVLEDAAVLAAVNKQLNLKKLNIEWVYHHVVEQYSDALAALADPYLSERAADVRDVGKRVLQNLSSGAQNPFEKISEPCIIVARDLTPSDTAQLPRDKALGFVTDIGSKTSHSAIMARSMNIPAIVGLDSPPHRLHSGMRAILDGIHGTLILNPTPETEAEYGAVETRHEELELKLESLKNTRAVTLDGKTISLAANIEMLGDIPSILESGAEGVGLFRTEFLFANKPALPTENEQYEIYAAAARAVKPHPIILRTLDIGGDKLMVPYLAHQEPNPFLGVRAIRLCLSHPELFRTQLRAMLRAAFEGNVKIMYPMVSGVEEVRTANAMLYEELARLKQAGTCVPDQIEIGAMIEIPSAALTAHIIAREVQFFSIGTNDLIQYTIAIDRGNEKLAHLYQPTHPAILCLLDKITAAARDNGIWCGVCGEMAGEFVLVPLLIGLGVAELSVGAAAVPRIKKVIQSVSYQEVSEMAQSLLLEPSAATILARLEQFARERFPDLFE